MKGKGGERLLSESYENEIIRYINEIKESTKQIQLCAEQINKMVAQSLELGSLRDKLIWIIVELNFDIQKVLGIFSLRQNTWNEQAIFNTMEDKEIFLKINEASQLLQKLCERAKEKISITHLKDERAKRLQSLTISLKEKSATFWEVEAKHFLSLQGEASIFPIEFIKESITEIPIENTSLQNNDEVPLQLPRSSSIAVPEDAPHSLRVKRAQQKEELIKALIDENAAALKPSAAILMDSRKQDSSGIGATSTGEFPIKKSKNEFNIGTPIGAISSFREMVTINTSKSDKKAGNQASESSREGIKITKQPITSKRLVMPASDIEREISNKRPTGRGAGRGV